MAINIAARRGAKDQRRKAVVAQKRKEELAAGSISGQVRLAASEPIRHCMLSEGLFDSGMGMLVVARGATPHNLSMVTFLLDIFALGVKDVFFRALSGHSFARHIEHMSGTSPMVPVDPADGRKLLKDLVAWAREIGVAPHRDYAKMEPIFGGVDAGASEAEFQFGYDGKPLFVGDISTMELSPGMLGGTMTIEGEAIRRDDAA